jgi:hypothetical protein
MRKYLFLLLVAGGISFFGVSGASAAPANGGVIAGMVQSTPLIENVRLYCMNRYTGRFLYWGRCGGYHHYYRRHYYHHYYSHYWRPRYRHYYYRRFW